jgi:hypothetical protein
MHLDYQLRIEKPKVLRPEGIIAVDLWKARVSGPPSSDKIHWGKMRVDILDFRSLK